MTTQTLKPVINLPNLYINGCNYIVSATTQASLGVTAGILNIFPGIARDSTNTFDISVPAPLTVNTRTTGPNGLDIGTIAVDTLYAIYLQFDPYGNLPTCAVISKNLNTAPTMVQSGTYQYSAYRLIGYVLSAHTSSGEATDLVCCTQPLMSNYREHSYLVDTTQVTGFKILAAGSSNANTAIAVNTAAPSGAAIVPTTFIQSLQLAVQFTGATAGDSTSVHTDSGFGPNWPLILCQVATVANMSQLKIAPTEYSTAGPSIYYKNSTTGGSTSIWVSGFNFSI